MAFDLTDSYVRSELRDALVDGLRAQDQAFMDRLMVRLVLKDGCHPRDVEPLLREAVEILKTKDHAAYEYWVGSCPCGLNLH